MLGAHLWGMCLLDSHRRGLPILQPFDQNRKSNLKKLNSGFGVFVKVGVDYENVSKLWQYVDPK